MKKIDIKNVSKIFPLIGIVVLIYIIVDIGAEKIANAFFFIPLHLYAIALLLFIPNLLLSIYKWQFISKKQKMDFSKSYLAMIHMISLFYSIITPIGIGWHLRIYYLKEKSKASWEKCITNSLIDSNLDFLSGIFISLIGSLIFIEYVSGLFSVLLAFFIFYLIIFVVLMKKERGNKIFNIFIRPIIPGRFKETIVQSVESLYEDLPKIRDMFFPFLIACLTWIVSATQVYIIALAFPIKVPVVFFILIIIISVVTAQILPISVAGLGIREGVLVVLLSIFGVQSENAFAISIGGYLVRILIPGMIGWIISFQNTLNQPDNNRKLSCFRKRKEGF